jgi:signal transduction histidine kinase
VHVDALTDLWPDALPDNAAPDYVIALLNDKAKPVVTQPPAEKGRDWRRPFVASEVGEALPHWEAALYLMRPQQLLENAQGVRRTLLLLIAAALAAIAFGGWAVFADARRQLALAQKKTDFVSNVSHELKTPLTSIRMFAEMMQSGSADEEKRPQYLRIIVAEAERLTRLINNVLDFARLERKQKRYDFHPLDLHEVIARTWEGHELHLREQGFATRWQAAPPPYPVRGNDDALAQILVNLLSNAEKYSTERKEVEIHSYLTENSVHVSVLDRGSGVPPGEEAKIFEAFYRAHDSLASGIQGSGLGLTLAQRLAKEHGGEITFQAREGGGSNVTLRIPLTRTGGNRARA